MFQGVMPLSDWSSQTNLIAQLAAPSGIVVAEDALVFSVPQFLVAFISGLMMTFGFQLLLTNLSIAFISFPRGESDKDDDSESFGSTLRSIETKVGLWVLLTVTIAVFVACFLAVKLSLVNSAFLGAIIGVVIWSTYFSLLVWLGSSAVGSLVGSVISTATAGLQSIIGTTAAAIGANMAKHQAVSTAEDITAAVRRELTAGLDTGSIRRTLQNSLKSLQPQNLDLDNIGSHFEKVLNESDLKNVTDPSLLENVNRKRFVDLVSSRTDFSKRDINLIADRLEATWKQVMGQGRPIDLQDQISSLLKSAKLEDLSSQELSDKLQQLIRQHPQKDSGFLSRTFQLGLSALLSQVLQNVDLSDLDVEKVAGQLQKLKSTVLAEAGQRTAGKDLKTFSVIQADLEDYLLFSPPWELSPDAVKQQFKDIVVDPQADPESIRHELELVNRNYLIQTLSLRDDLKPERVQEIANQMEETRQHVFAMLQKSEDERKAQALRSQVETYLNSASKDKLTSEAIHTEFKALLSDPDAGVDTLASRLSQFDRDMFLQLLEQRQDITPEDADQIVSQLEITRDLVLSEAESAQEQAMMKTQELRGKVEDYLRNTPPEALTAEGIQRDLRTLLDDPQAGVNILKSRLSQFDRPTLAQILSQRQDLSQEQGNQVLDQAEAVRDSLLQAPQKVSDKAKEYYEQTTTKIANYLHDTDLEELNPEGIQRDLTTLLADPQIGASALRDRLSQVDRETLVKLLSQRGDLTEEQVNQTLDQLQSAIRNIIKAPRRLARRAQKQALAFEDNLENYLRNTNKEELSPEGIKRDLQLVLQHPRAGLGSLGDRISNFDRSTFVALLSQRDDISEEEANRIADQIESTYHSLVQQIQNVQLSIQSAIDTVFAKIRDYLNSLERPELNYEGIQEDFQKLFDDPQVGFDALRDRLGHFDRGTLVAILSSREDISEADANRLLDKIEETRDSVLHQAEQIQHEVQMRFRRVKEQAQRQALETQKVAAGAAWWLFSTALTSLAASALAGTLAVTVPKF